MIGKDTIWIVRSADPKSSSDVAMLGGFFFGAAFVYRDDLAMLGLGMSSFGAAFVYGDFF